MGHTAAVSDDEQSWMTGLEMLVQRHLHIIKLNLHAIEQRIVIGCTWCDLVQRVDHLDDSVQYSLGDDQAQVARRCGQRWFDEGVANAGRRAALSAD